MVQEVNKVQSGLIQKFYNYEAAPRQVENDVKLFAKPTEGNAVTGREKLENGETNLILNSVEVVAKANKKQAEIPMPDIEISHEITMQSNKPLAAELIAKNGGKTQKREVNGQKQEIAIIKHGKEEHKFLVNEDGTLGEPLVTLSSRGNNKYITQSEHQRRINEVFPDGLPDGVKTSYAYRDGNYQLVFTKNDDMA